MGTDGGTDQDGGGVGRGANLFPQIHQKFMETQKTPNSQSNLKKEKQRGRNQAP